MKTGGKIYLALILVFLYLPIGTLVVFSFNSSKSMFVWSGFSLRWYEEMFSNKQILDAIWNMFSIALFSALISTVIGTLACVGMQAMKKKAYKLIMGLTDIPLLNADIVIGISLMMTYLVLGIPLTPNAYEAALDLGASPRQAFFKVVLPDLMPGISSGFLLAFTMSVDDFVITHFTRGAGINTISTLIYSQVKVGIRPTLFALSTVIFAVVLIVLVIGNEVSSRRERKNRAGGDAATGVRVRGLKKTKEFA